MIRSAGSPDRRLSALTLGVVVLFGGVVAVGATAVALLTAALWPGSGRPLGVSAPILVLALLASLALASGAGIVVPLVERGLVRRFRVLGRFR